VAEYSKANLDKSKLKFQFDNDEDF
jgi:hypothetical protein